MKYSIIILQGGIRYKGYIYIYISSDIYKLYKVSLPCEKNWETSKIKNERIPYFEVGSTFEGKGDLEEGYFSRDKFDGEGLQIENNFYDTPTCFESILSLRLECTSSCHDHETKYIEDVWAS